MTAVSVRPPRSLAVPLSASLLLHVAAAVAFLFARAGEHRIVVPQAYKVTLVSAAPAEVIAPGVVTPPKTVQSKPVPARPREVKPKPVPSRTATKAPPVKSTTSVPEATKTAAKQEQPKAGGTIAGGKGADVVTVNFEGQDFPFPGYLDNIVNQVRRFFQWDGSANYRADVQFFIRRDGSVADVRIIPANTSASYEFKFAATGAIDRAGKVKAFGPLPKEFPDDVLQVIFSFDKRIIP